MIAAGNAIVQEQFITHSQYLFNINTNDQQPTSIQIQLVLPLEISKSSGHLYPSASNTLIHSHEHAGIDGQAAEIWDLHLNSHALTDLR